MLSSNSRIDSSSSPKNSSLSGRSASGGNRSTTFPRTLNSPRPSTSVTLPYPPAVSLPANSSRSRVSPTETHSLYPSITSRGGSFCIRARTETTMTPGGPYSRRWRASRRESSVSR